MPEKMKSIIIIPAHNESKNIGKTIDLIRSTGAKAEILVVNNGSTDNTAKIAKAKGCEVLTIKRNRGKTSAFFAGIKEAVKINPDAMVTIDADCTNIPKKTMQALVGRAAGATKANKTLMVIAKYTEYPTHPGSYHLSGTRSYSLPALWRLRASKFKSVPKGFGIEMFLNNFFEKNCLRLKTPAIRYKEPFKTKASMNQARDISNTINRMIKKKVIPRPRKNALHKIV